MKSNGSSNNSMGTRLDQINRLILEGLTNREIGDRLGLVEKTVKCYIVEIFKAKKVKNRAQLIVKHYQARLKELKRELSRTTSN
jgi:DNA-binding NarL/FixJ family response regulator